MFKRMVPSILACISVTVLIFAAVSESQAAVRFNPQTGLWEGNICANPYAWTYVPFQPIGTLCVIRLPNGFVQQGMIINQ